MSTERATYEDITDVSREAAGAPTVGDVWQEMYSFWVAVVAVTNTHVIVVRWSGTGRARDDGLARAETHDLVEFRRKYASNMLCSYRGHDVTGWLEEALLAEAEARVDA